jgi:isopenicillin-N epimerase
VRAPADLSSDFDLDPAVVHLNHGAFGVTPRVVDRAQQQLRERAAGNPYRFNRIEVVELLATARDTGCAFLGLGPEDAALVRNVSEGVSTVLAALQLQTGDEVVVCDHGYGAVRLAVQHWRDRAGAVLRVARVPLAASDDEVVQAYAAQTSGRTRLAIVDQITSPTAAVLPVAAVAAALGDVPVLADAAHVPGTLPTDIAALGAAFWVGNLHKWAFTPRGSALLWAAPPWRERLHPLVLSWGSGSGFPAAWDQPGTADHTGWAAIPAGLDYWRDLGGWRRTALSEALVIAGQHEVADLVGTELGGLPPTPAPTMRLVRLPAGLLSGPDDVEPLYDRLSTEHHVECAPVWFGGEGFVRVAGQAYNSVDDYRQLGSALRSLAR